MAEVCGRCGQEVRYGVRPSPARPPADQGSPYWMHRDVATDLDHVVIHGTPWTPELQAKLDAGVAAMAERGKADTKKKQEKIEEEEDDGPDVWDQVPDPEVTAHPVDIATFRPRSGIRQVFNLATKTDGWEVRSLTASRGPFVGARGQVLSISDSVLMKMRGPMVDTGRQVAVAFWRDEAFKFAYTGILRDGVVYTQPVNSNGLKAFIKGE